MGILSTNASMPIDAVEPKLRELWAITELTVGAAGEKLRPFLNTDYDFNSDSYKVLWNNLINSISNTRAPLPSNHRPLAEIKRAIRAELSLRKGQYYWKQEVSPLREKMKLELYVTYGDTYIQLVTFKAVRNSRKGLWLKY